MLWLICQRYNLKAIHNSDRVNDFDAAAVVNMSKIQSESNSQLTQAVDSVKNGCG